jgi:hypothetical protein
MRSKLDAVLAGSENEQRLSNDKLDATIVQLNNLTDVTQVQARRRREGPR